MGEDEAVNVPHAAILLPSGNPTCILPAPFYDAPAAFFQRLLPRLGVEQVGVVTPRLHLTPPADPGHPAGTPARTTFPALRMMGGELSVNGLASAFFAIYRWYERRPRFSFACDIAGDVLMVSGAASHGPGEDRTDVSLRFGAFPFETTRTAAGDGSRVRVVALPGITHVLVDDPTGEPAPARVRELVDRFAAGSPTAALGVIFVRRTPPDVRIVPYVYVRALDVLTRETSCGSAAVALALDAWRRSGRRVTSMGVVQPSGARVHVRVTRGQDAGPAVEFTTGVRWLQDVPFAPAVEPDVSGAQFPLAVPGARQTG
ncbi:hypothetical protein [Actinacidiphila epipremni]|uniref:Diaminopimelate epimerase n=1 Tax=Actinacidiphila epipremni TaxID=2053013 RepID=A0ABX0ZSU8_9ACTN|nr:hypothetical protein [Actinacidiphila epipremni]NJP46037.1 hypothetical protein [Actinacidiphila epipremni]